MRENFEGEAAVNVVTPRSNRRKVVNATVINCTRLNVRNAADADAPVVGVISPTDHVRVNLEESNGEYYRILEPVYGFAKKNFIGVK